MRLRGCPSICFWLFWVLSFICYRPDAKIVKHRAAWLSIDTQLINYFYIQSSCIWLINFFLSRTTESRALCARSEIISFLRRLPSARNRLRNVALEFVNSWNELPASPASLFCRADTKFRVRGIPRAKCKRACSLQIAWEMAPEGSGRQ